MKVFKKKIIASARFMVTSLSKSCWIHKIRWKDYDCFLEYKSVIDNLIKYQFYLAIKVI